MGLMGLSLLRLKIRVEKAIVARSNWTKMAKVLISPQVPLPVPVDGDVGSSSGAARGARRKPIGELWGGEGAIVRERKRTRRMDWVEKDDGDDEEYKK